MSGEREDGMRSAFARLLLATVTLSGVFLPAPPVGAGGEVPGVSAPGHRVRYLVPPNPINQTDGMALDGKGGLFVTQALYNRVVHVDLKSLALTVIADETDAAPVQAPDDITMGPDGNLYVTELLGRKVTRLSPDGRQRKVLGTNLGDGGTGTNGIAFNAEGRLFATDLSFADPSHPGGLWEVDPQGVKPPVPVLRRLPTPEGFGFGPDGLAYVPEMFAGRIDVIDVNARTVRKLVDGFGDLVALKVDREGRLVVMETDTGRLWRVDRTSGARTFLAQAPRGLDNLVVDQDGTIYVSNFVQGNIWRVDQAAGTVEPLLPDRSLTLPFSLSQAPDGSLVVGDFTAVAQVTGSQVSRHNRLLVDGPLQLLTPGAAQVGTDLYYSDFLPPDGRIFRIDLSSGTRQLVAGGLGFPWHVRAGPDHLLLVSDQALGAVLAVDPGTGRKTPVLQGLHSPSGLAFDAGRGVVYVSDTGAGRVLSVAFGGGAPSVVATGLTGPEGVAVDRDGSLLVVEGDAGRLVRLDPVAGRRTVVATGLPTRTVGFGVPLMNYSSDVLVREDGSIVVSGDRDGSLIELSP
ncbi:MAG: SMP-30/gluconolactonase/LRE family protein [Actinobacteria bacterium]|nr:SMP-30/gluconolactonase/LRE family protein [Actinomycetota bacterium]